MITEATPITTPSSVRTLRSLFDHKDCSANFEASTRTICGPPPISQGVMFGSAPPALQPIPTGKNLLIHVPHFLPVPASLISQRFDGVQVCRLPRRINAKHQSNYT